MRVDLHNHTIYCNHATGTMQEYVEKANKINIDIFGFSCHAPMKFDEKYRMDLRTMYHYLQQLNDLEEYAKERGYKTKILKGLEVDYILDYENLIESSVLNAEVDYLIGSVHFIGNWGFDNPESISGWEKYGVFKTWDIYFDSIQSMAKTKYFQIVGHFDLPKIFGSVMPKELNKKMESTLQILHENNIVLEVNAAGLRKHIKEQYPTIDILKKAKEIGLDITLGSDAHSVEQIGFGYETCVKIIKDIGFNNVAIFKNKEKIMLEL